jgi:hypothetical protein
MHLKTRSPEVRKSSDGVWLAGLSGRLPLRLPRSKAVGQALGDCRRKVVEDILAVGALREGCRKTQGEIQVVPRLRLACILLPSPQPSPRGRGSPWGPRYSPLALWERARVRGRSCYDVSHSTSFETTSLPCPQRARSRASRDAPTLVGPDATASGFRRNKRLRLPRLKYLSNRYLSL